MKTTLVSIAFMLTGCVGDTVAVDAPCPSRAEFFGDQENEVAGVSELLEERCGTLDCHGSIARPLRIYGRNGLRLFNEKEFNDNSVAIDANTVSGGKDTTDDERTYNYRSVCGLEPENMLKVVTKQIEPSTLLILGKPAERGDELNQKHKGGKLFAEGDAAWDCIEEWLNGALIPGDCEEAVSAN